LHAQAGATERPQLRAGRSLRQSTAKRLPRRGLVCEDRRDAGVG
jgi:hypothetical protein